MLLTVIEYALEKTGNKWEAGQNRSPTFAVKLCRRGVRGVSNQRYQWLSEICQDDGYPKG